MNIFVLHENPKIAAIYHHNKHIVKMPLETAQMLSTSHHMILGDRAQKDKLYKCTHYNHGCNVWLRQSLSNYNWLCELGIRLCEEYEFRYKRSYASLKVIKYAMNNPIPIDDIGLTPFYLAMPDFCKESSVVESYRNFYCYEKLASYNSKYNRWEVNKWKNRNKPSWINKNQRFNQLYTLGIEEN